jgi:hypothetical protein
LRTTAVKALTCEPTDSFLWLALYWAEISREGYSARSLSYLEMSYRFGRFEGWVGLRRIELALRAFDDLPSWLREQVVDEFAHLLDSWFVNETVTALTGPGWPVRDRLLSGLSQVGQGQRRVFARELVRRGYRLDVPGVEVELRPWN